MSGSKQNQINTKQLVTMAMLVALAYAVMFVTRIPLMASAEFLKYDPKDVVLAIGAFLYGPMAGALMSFAICFLEMVTVSTSGFIGFIMNWLASMAFICPAAVIYRHKRSISGAVLGLLLGCIAMTATMLLWNYIVTPIYRGWPREQVAAMLLPVFLPFNAIKSVLNSSMTLMLYQPITNALRRSKLLPPLPDGSHRRKINVGLLMFALVVAITCVLMILVLRGMI